ncbi:hypothetical protein RIF29_42482 [Crotalaria pallida]|uniref:Uncharacterized protein n=1 Tax=Crotalaria pallida TaxID=3830 RepID=A0AAN9E7M8_CROPI
MLKRHKSLPLVPASTDKWTPTLSLHHVAWTVASPHSFYFLVRSRMIRRLSCHSFGNDERDIGGDTKTCTAWQPTHPTWAGMLISYEGSSFDLLWILD